VQTLGLADRRERQACEHSAHFNTLKDEGGSERATRRTRHSVRALVAALLKHCQRLVVCQLRF